MGRETQAGAGWQSGRAVSNALGANGDKVGKVGGGGWEKPQMSGKEWMENMSSF